MDSVAPNVCCEAFASRIIESLYPQPYSERLDTTHSPFALALSSPRNYRGSWLLGIPGFRKIAPKLSTARYMMFVRQFSEAVEIADVVAQARKEIIGFSGATIGLRAVGAYLIIVGSRVLWRPDQMASLLDTTGLHSVVIQALHLVDPQTQTSKIVSTEYHRPQDIAVSDISRRVDDAISAFA